METLCIEKLKQKAKELPQKPGVYRHFGEQKQILYVGKAVNLRQRVLSYFSNVSKHSPKTKALVSRILDFDFTILQSDEQALVLENNLIKHHQPPFNILLRDDKTYPFLRVDLDEDWPRLRIVRRMGSDKAHYFGPYTSSKDLKALIEALAYQYPLVRCSPTVFKTIKRPCNFYHIKKCLAPCHLPVDRQVYMGMIDDIISVLKGQIHLLINRLEEQMHVCAEKLQYELAGKCRDRIKVINSLNTPKTLALLAPESAECLAFGVSLEGRVQCTWVKVQEGRIVRLRTCHGDAIANVWDTEALSSLLTTTVEQVLDAKSLSKDLFLVMPQSIYHSLLPHKRILENYLQSRFPAIEHLQWGADEEQFSDPKIKSLVIFALREMEIGLKRQAQAFKPYEALEDLKNYLKLKKIPRRLECYDISTFRGGSTYGSQIVFIDGEPDSKLYRLYKLKTLLSDSNDFLCLKEVLERRLSKLPSEDAHELLIVVDGGIPQVRAVQSVLNASQFKGVPLLGLAKSRVVDNHGFSKALPALHSSERIVIWDQKGPLESSESYMTYPLNEGTSLFRLLTHARDEAHRFAINAHRKGRSKRSLASVLDTIEGVGPIRKSKLLERFGSVAQLRGASLEEIASCLKVTTSFAKKILEDLDLAHQK